MGNFTSWPPEKTYRSDLMQIALKRETEAVEVQIIEVVIERILTATVVNTDKGGRVNPNTYISCPISKNPSNKNEAKAVALSRIH